ncbi:MAG: hypothetical protein JWQ33_2789 [Ramlibacter sp.]|nr:hypothetical protein [Ramlibacter sp.]
MTDQSEGRAPERQSIDLHDDDEILFWCQKLQCSEEDLRRAVADVGQAPLPVAEYLGLTEAALS